MDNTDIDLLDTYCASFSKNLIFLNVVLILAGFLPLSLETTIFTSIPRFCNIHDKSNISRHFTVLNICGKRLSYSPGCRPCPVLTGFPGRALSVKCQAKASFSTRGLSGRPSPIYAILRIACVCILNKFNLFITVGLFQSVHALVGPARWLRAWEGPSCFQWNIEPGPPP